MCTSSPTPRQGGDLLCFGISGQSGERLAATHGLSPESPANLTSRLGLPASLRHVHGPRAALARPGRGREVGPTVPSLLQPQGWTSGFIFFVLLQVFISFYFKFRPKNSGVIPNPYPPPLQRPSS